MLHKPIFSKNGPHLFFQTVRTSIISLRPGKSAEQASETSAQKISLKKLFTHRKRNVKEILMFNLSFT